jgi:uncharacterized protein
MIAVPQMIRSACKITGVQQYIIEKDYALSYLLAAISETDGLCNQLVLKGGTALRKFYFKDYRFSEDLDYSTREVGPCLNLDDCMKTATRKMEDLLTVRGPFRVELEPLILKHPHPGDQKAYQVRVQFPEQRQALCRLKVEITVDESILFPIVMLPLIHDFPEDIENRIAVYSLAEITAEKMRALLQSKVRLQERGWGASRVCRDYYDLRLLLQQPQINKQEFLPLLASKCLTRGVIYQSANDFISEDLLAVAKKEWEQQILPFNPLAPPAQEILLQVQSSILALWE